MGRPAVGKRFWLTVLVLAVVIPVTPLRAAEDQSIDALRASDAELTTAIAALDREVVAQQAAVTTAQQALDAANQAVVSNDAALFETEARFGELREIAADRAVSQYMRPHDGDMTKAVVGGGSLSDVTRRAGLLAEVNDRDADALDEMRAIKIELDRERQTALAARELADERRRNEQTKLDELNASRAEKAHLDASLKERIARYAAEDEAAARIGAGGAGGRASRSGGDGGVDGRVSAAGMGWPTASSTVSSPFGYRWGRRHAGIDIQGGSGTPIYAAKSGSVAQAGWESGYGNYTCIDHGGGFSTCYAHQSDMVVSAGSSVQQGQLIGYVGNTGASQAAHLHFETRVNGSPRDPIQYLP